MENYSESLKYGEQGHAIMPESPIYCFEIASSYYGLNSYIEA